MASRITGLFPLWAVLAALLAWAVPGPFTALGWAIVPLLALVMFLMGLTLTPADFSRLLRAPRGVLAGVVLQFAIMPLAALAVARVLQLPQDLAVGLIVVGCCAGGTASNVITYLARGNVALSITMTACSTLAGVVLTPLLCGWYIDQAVAVDRWSMFASLVQMVLVPVVAGIVLNTWRHGAVARLEPWLPAAAVLAIVLIIAIIAGLNHAQLAQMGPLVLVAVIAHNSLGMLGGYGASRLLRLPHNDCRTIAIEVGMQNSGLGVALALQYFTPLSALPGAVFSVWHNMSGSLLAAWWRRHPAEG